jgi:hypothetical protein
LLQDDLLQGLDARRVHDGERRWPVIHHPECKRIIPQIMLEHGVDPESLYFDVPRMRSAYRSHFLSSGIAYAFHPHRDPSYSAPMCQLNWWLPVYPIEPDNAMGFYPRYFGEAVKNNSEIYNYYEWNTKYRATAVQHIKSDTREQPKAHQEFRACHRALPPSARRYDYFLGRPVARDGAEQHERRALQR